MPFQTFGQLSETRRNNFDFLRFFFASLVIFSHSYMILRADEVVIDPLSRASHMRMSLGTLSVACFFAISGFLITQSWLRTPQARDYFKKRALRIYPGWIAALLFGVLVVGPLLRSPLRLDLGNPMTYHSFPRLLLYRLGTGQFLPDIKHGLPYTINGSTWTIPFELLCYGLAAALGILGVYRRRGLVLVPAVALLVYVSLPVQVIHRLFGPAAPHLSAPYFGDVTFLPIFGMYFLWGALFFLFRDRIPHSPWLLLVSLVLVGLTLWGLPLGPIMLAVVSTAGFYVLFYLAFLPVGRLHAWAKHGDLSYGLYLYAFPIQLLVISEQFRGYHLTPWALFLAAWVLSVGAAALSWRFVERPFLRLKPKSPGRPAEDAGVPAVPGRQEQIA